MPKTLLLTLLLITMLVCFLRAASDREQKLKESLAEVLPPGVDIIQLPNEKLFIQIHPSLGMNHHDADEACKALGASLADLYDNPDLRYLGERVDGPHWIKSFNGDHFEAGLPAALYPGAAIATPRNLSEDPCGVLCQV